MIVPTPTCISNDACVQSFRHSVIHWGISLPLITSVWSTQNGGEGKHILCGDTYFFRIHIYTKNCGSMAFNSILSGWKNVGTFCRHVPNLLPHQQQQMGFAGTGSGIIIWICGYVDMGIWLRLTHRKSILRITLAFFAGQTEATYICLQAVLNSRSW